MILIVVLYAVFAAMTFINSQLMLSNPYPFFVGMCRAFGSSFLLLLYALFKDFVYLKHFSLPKQGWKDLLIYAVFVHGFAMSGFSVSVQYTDPVKVCFIIALAPFLTAIMLYFMSGEKLSVKKMIGLGLGFIGLVPILFEADHGQLSETPRHLAIFGDVACFIAVLCFAYGWIVLKRFLHQFHKPIAIVNGISMAIGGCVSALICFGLRGMSMFSLTFTDSFGPLMVAFTLSSLLTYVIYVYLLRVYSATFIAFAGFLEPVFGLLFGVLFMGHGVSTLSIGALMVLALGLYVFYQEELKVIVAK